METLWARRPDVQGLRLSISPGLSRRSSQDQGLHGHVAVRQHPQMSEVTKCKQLLHLNILKGSKCALNLYSARTMRPFCGRFSWSFFLLLFDTVLEEKQYHVKSWSFSLLLLDMILEDTRCQVKTLVLLPASVDMILEGGIM